MLTHGYIKMENIVLMVIDECHNARKNHVYAQIMKDFYWPVARSGDKSGLPKVGRARPAQQ
jgi:endoribonuclease Dicer